MLDATRALLEEVGYAGLTVVAVAARAQTSAPAVYRRFSSKAELVYQAAFPSAEAEDTGVDPDVWRASLEDGVHGLVTAISEFLHRPAVRAAIAGLQSEMSAHPGLSGELLGRWQSRTYERFQQCLDAAASAGTARGDVDPRRLLDLVTGAVLVARFNERRLDSTWIEETADLVIRGIAA